MSNPSGFKVNFFVSHKHEYESAARGLKDILELYGGRDITVFISEEILAGDDWFKWISKSLRDSNILLLLFTEATASWDWPLYEAGLFTQLEGDDPRRVVCLHHPKLEPPKPLKHLQAVPAKEDRMISFLKELFGSTKITGLSEPINTTFAKDEEKLKEAAREICSYFVPHEVIKRHYNRFIDLCVANPDEINSETIPGDAVITSDLRTLESFGLAQGRTKWKDIERKAKEEAGEYQWLKEITRAVHQAKKGDIPEPVFTTFHAWRSGVLLRPELYRTDEVSDGSMVFHILFVEELGGPISGMPDNIKALATSLRFAFRFHWEVIEKFGRPDLTEEDIEKLEAALHHIEVEAAFYGLHDPELVKSQFVGHDADRIKEMYDSWSTLRNDECTGSLDRALETKDAKQIGQILSDLLPLNKEYVELVSKRFADAVEESAKA